MRTSPCNSNDAATSGEDLFVLPFVRTAGVWQLDSEVYTHLRRIYDHELVYIVSGIANITVNDQVYRARADHLFLIQPGVWHMFRPDGSDSMTLMGVHFDWPGDCEADPLPTFADIPSSVIPNERLWRKPLPIGNWNLDASPFLDLAGRPAVRHLLEQVVASFALHHPYSARQAGALLEAAIFQVAEEARHLTRVKDAAAFSRDTLQRIHEVRELLENPGPANAYRSVDEVAAHVGWSPDHVRRVLRRSLGMAPIELQNIARVQRAQSLLQNGCSVSEAAYQCGFSDPAYFSRVFRKYSAGVSPRNFALQHQPTRVAWIQRLSVAPENIAE